MTWLSANDKERNGTELLCPVRLPGCAIFLGLLSLFIYSFTYLSILRQGLELILWLSVIEQGEG